MSRQVEQDSGAPWYKSFFGQPWLDNFLLQIPPRHTAREVDGVIERLELTGGARVLDLACGYGRHSLELAGRGFRVTGLDLSEPSLAIARKKSEEAGVAVDFVHSDMREIPFVEEMDAVINMYSSFGFLETEAEDELVLAAVARCLKPGGRFLLDTSSALYLFRNYKPQVWVELADGTILLERQIYDVRSGRTETTWRFLSTSGEEHRLYFSMRAYTLPELVNMLRRAGMEPHAVFGSLDGEEYDLDSPRLVLVAAKPSV
ncbi:MAG: class I SAM-dependent methyltransferase [Actinomycetota bacterium]|nr:class I SAM-dependent methyltransferase [Actinomycetota bacterium]